MTHLSPRERQVVVLIGSEGCHYATAGKRLGISSHTVRAYVREVGKRYDPGRAPREAVIALYYSELAPSIAGATAEGG